MDYYIFRHGITYFSKNDILYGDQIETAEILPEATPSLERLGQHLKEVKTDFNVSSPFLRCRQTVKIVMKESGKMFDFDPLLHDYDSRNETIVETGKRIEEFYQKLNTTNYNSVAVCTHGYPIAMLKSLILEGAVNLDKIADYPTTGVLLVIKSGKAEEVNFNENSEK